ncbi:MAG: hypothetical protein QM610_12220 [Chitinophagaceae bacterium]
MTFLLSTLFITFEPIYKVFMCVANPLGMSSDLLVFYTVVDMYKVGRWHPDTLSGRDGKNRCRIPRGWL